MSRWMFVLLLAMGLVLSASAQEGAVETPAEGTPATTTTAPAEDTAEGTPSLTKQDLATKAKLHELLEGGKVTDAEAAYLGWAAYWHEDDPVIAKSLLHGVLLDQYRAGKLDALVAMVKAGDADARNLIRERLVAGDSGLAPADMAAAVAMIGQAGEKTTLNTLRLLLYSKDQTVANAAITALGNLGDRRVAPDLLAMFDEANVETSVLLAQALNQLGAGKAVRARFSPQLRFPQPPVRTKAALVLGAMGDPSGWVTIRQAITTKDKAYYPLALTIIGALPSQESTALVTAALGGSEAEQLAALQSISLLKEKIDKTLLALVREEKNPLSVRVAAIDMLGARKASIAVKEMRLLATSLGAEDAKLKAAAMQNLPKYGLLTDITVRDTVRMRFESEQPEVALAARAALLNYAIMATTEQ